VNTGAFIGGAIGPVIFGVFLDKMTGSATGIELYQLPMMFLLLMNTVGLVASFFVKDTKCKNILQKDN
jgi:hypothetical protein